MKVKSAFFSADKNKETCQNLSAEIKGHRCESDRSLEITPTIPFNKLSTYL